MKSEKHDLAASELLEALEKDKNIDSSLKTEILSLNFHDPYTIVAKLLIYAIKNNNKTIPKPNKVVPTNDKSPEESIDEIIKLLGELPKPVAIDVPAEITVAEMTYVSTILEAFSEDSCGDNEPGGLISKD